MSTLVDYIEVHQLAIKTIIGVNDWERHLPQTLFLDLRLGLDLSKPSQSDALVETIDYDTLSRWINEQLSKTCFQLIEKIAGFTAEQLLIQFPLIQEITVSVTKPVAVPIAQAVKVTMKRQRQPFTEFIPHASA